VLLRRLAESWLQVDEIRCERARPGDASIITSGFDDFDENARASCAYDASEAAGCGTRSNLDARVLLEAGDELLVANVAVPDRAVTDELDRLTLVLGFDRCGIWHSRRRDRGGLRPALRELWAAIVPATATLSDAMSVTRTDQPCYDEQCSRLHCYPILS